MVFKRVTEKWVNLVRMRLSFCVTFVENFIKSAYYNV